MQIREYLASDRASVIALWWECGLVVEGKNDPEADIALATNSVGADILIGLIGEELAATVMVGHDGHRGWLYYVAVKPAHQRQGLGRHMVRAAETWFRDRGVPKSQLMIRETNIQVEAFYERLGYKAIPRIVMQKVL